jgi:hypothetical protein
VDDTFAAAGKTTRDKGMDSADGTGTGEGLAGGAIELSSAANGSIKHTGSITCSPSTFIT